MSRCDPVAAAPGSVFVDPRCQTFCYVALAWCFKRKRDAAMHKYGTGSGKRPDPTCAINQASMAEYRDEHIPLAYLITFRAYGTWLHGDQRGSVNRFHNRFGTSLIDPNKRWRKYNHRLLCHSPVKLRSRQRALVEEAIRETCKKRKWEFWATNVRTNHVHTVVGAACNPERILIAALHKKWFCQSS